MSSREIKDLAETAVDGLKFAADGGRLSGKLALSGLPRLLLRKGTLVAFCSKLDVAMKYAAAVPSKARDAPTAHKGGRAFS